MSVKDTPPWRLDPFQRIVDFHWKKKGGHHHTTGGTGGLHGHYIWTVATWTIYPNIFEYTGVLGADADFSAAAAAFGAEQVAYYASIGQSALYIGTMAPFDPAPTTQNLWEQGFILSGAEINPSTGYAWWPHGSPYQWMFAGLRVNV